MKNDRLVQKPETNGAFRARLLMVCFLFALGAVLGALGHGVVTVRDDQQLRAYVLQFAQVSAGADDRVASAFSVLAVYYRYALLTVICGFLTGGLLLIPLLCMMQGFSLSFSVCCFASAMGRSGVMLALAAFGVRCLIALPCTFYLAAQAMARSYDKLQTVKQKEKPRITSDAWPILKCFLILLFGVVTELTVVPRLLQMALSGIS